MKKIFCLLMMVIFSFCVIVNAKSEIIVNDDNTITYNGEIYSYTVDDTDIELDYKTCKYFSSTDEYGTRYGTVDEMTDDCTMEDYSDVLDKIAEHESISAEKVQEEAQKEEIEEEMPALIILVFLMIAIGLINLFVPEFSWTFTYGLHIKDAKPTETSLLLYRISGAIMLVVAIILLAFAVTI